ncbi:MAG: DUF1295 domain-containing protein [Pseudomonadota bacterium]
MIETGSILRELSTPVPATFALTCLAFTLLWAISVRLRDASIVDLYWGLGFTVIGWALVWLVGLPGLTGLVILLAVTLWSLRLWVHLSIRHFGMDGEDPRYAAIRRANDPGYIWKSLPMIFWLQAVLMSVIATPLYAALLLPTNNTIVPLFAFGIAVFSAGFVIEAIADWQLARFRSNKANAGRLLDSGLWGYSRHPHYFGESLVWTGLGIAALAATGAWWAMISPVLITLLLLKVSGIPPLERHLSGSREGYEAYRDRVNAFIPGPPRGIRPAAPMRSPAE